MKKRIYRIVVLLDGSARRVQLQTAELHRDENASANAWAHETANHSALLGWRAIRTEARGDEETGQAQFPWWRNERDKIGATEPWGHDLHVYSFSEIGIQAVICPTGKSCRKVERTKVAARQFNDACRVVLQLSRTMLAGVPETQLIRREVGPDRRKFWLLSRPGE
jgi:hypothetical protein